MDINQTVNILYSGGIVIFPTDTAFGIGCRMDNQLAVDRLFQIRRRPTTQAVPLLVASKVMALAYYFSPSDVVRHLIDKYWPGALTIVAPGKKNLIYSLIRGDGENVGLRMPDYPLLLQIIEKIGVPILGPSANIHGHPTPYTHKDLDQELVKQVDYVLPGECNIKQVSTVIDCSIHPPKILRQGAVKILIK